VDEDLEILDDAGVFFSFSSGLEFGQGCFVLVAGDTLIFAGEFADGFIVLSETLGRGALWVVLVLDVEQKLGVFVGGDDPGAVWCRGGCGRGVWGDLGEGG